MDVLTVMITINANAKINLTLDILGKRADGYHEVAMIMQSVGLFDTLRFTEIFQPGIKLTVNVPGLRADGTNLVWKAAQLILDTYHINKGVHIELTKRIPIAAGLAGGSADAAAVLRGLSSLFLLHLSDDVLCELGAKLGSDVPFCIMGGTMLATGRGEVLERLPDMPVCGVVLVKPSVSVSTAWAYKNYDAKGTANHPDNESLQKYLSEGSLQGISKLLCNVLESVTIEKYEEILDYKKYMCQYGAMASLMSGSGPTVFGLTETVEEAICIANKLKNITNAKVFATKIVCRN